MTAPVVIISGPSGIGKSTLIERLMASCNRPLRLSISATTRAPRGTEQDGIHYHFWDKAAFESAIADGRLLEYALVHERDYYGTLRDEVEPFVTAGTGVILEIDVQGAAQVREKLGPVFSVFLYAPPEVFEGRLRARGTETEEAIQRRLRSAERESQRRHEYTLALMNDVLEETVERIRSEVEQLFDRAAGEESCSTI
jgi:guanylate kinase